MTSGLAGVNAATNTIRYNSVYVARPQLPPALNGAPYLYKLCGLAHTKAWRPDGTNDGRENEKLVCYTYDRREYPGNNIFNRDHQYFLDSQTVGVTTAAPLFGNLCIESGFSLGRCPGIVQR